jgi:alkyldihydroxyacetonephosphate synthase
MDRSPVDFSRIKSSTSAIDRRMVSHDFWPRRLIEKRERQPLTLAARVFWPSSDDEVSAIISAARRDRIPVVPYGAGSGVCAGISPTGRTWILDMKGMSRLLHIDAERHIAVVEAGMHGERFERALNASGYSLGHFPSSIYCSTVGGWVAARSAGQLSSRYGKIEDLVVAIEGVDGTGARIRVAVDDPKTGPGAVRLLVGSEGALAVITRITFRIHRLASHRWLRGFVCQDLETAISAMQTLLQSGASPSVLRLYDPLDTRLAGEPVEKSSDPDDILKGGIAHAGLEVSGPEVDHEEPNALDWLAAEVERVALFSRPGATRRIVGELLARPLLANSIADRWLDRAKLVVGLEGDQAELVERARDTRAILTSLGAKDAGSAPGARWLLHRHRISYRMSRAFAAGGWVDTMEVATGWENVVPLWRAVREALRDKCIVMCHMSHAYVDGCSLYFTFAGGGIDGAGPRSSLARYDQTWERALATVRRHGATLAHHHGIGRSKAAATATALPIAQVLAPLKRALDPDGILNPGVLGIGNPSSAGGA